MRRVLTPLVAALMLTASPGTAARTQRGQPAESRVLPPDSARMFKATSAEAWKAAQAWVKQRRFGIDKIDNGLQQIVTKPIPVTKDVFGFDEQAIDKSLAFAFVRLHIFVSPFVEPARVHVAVITDGRMPGEPKEPSLQPNRVSYYQPLVNGWVMNEIAGAIGSNGVAIPELAPARRALARTMAANPGDRCLADPAPSGTAGAPMPTFTQPVKRFEVNPIYPTDAVRAGQTGSVLVRGWIYDDGAFVATSSTPTGDLPSAIVASALGAVSLWRYTPAKADGCPFAMMSSVSVSFNLKR